MSWYHDYLATDWWFVTRFFELERAGHCCEFCGNDDCELNVHHLSYANLGNEQPEDLIVLCHSCHQDAHDFPKIGAEIRRFASKRPPAPSVAQRLQEYLKAVA